jgi:Family of unknown function (DUF5701)
VDVLVRRDELSPLETAIARAGGFVDMNPTTPEAYGLIPEVELPDAASYRVIDFDAGAEFFSVTPEAALPQILARGRSPLTIEEGIAVLLSNPEVLAAQNAFSLLGSRRGDRRVPALWLSGGRPRLGWCWAGAPHSSLGAASGRARVV